MYPSGPWTLKILMFAPSLPIAFFVVSHLYSTLSSPHQSKQTMTGRMNDQTDGQMNDEIDG
jgi:hypothetical protein